MAKDEIDLRRRLAEREYDTLRSEERHLKDCQLRYFTLSVIAAGAVFGFVGESFIFANPDNHFKLHRIAYLAALPVILPCWWIFFDKATTISRIVGYTRCLEEFLTNKSSTFAYQGWQTVLTKARSKSYQTNGSDSVLRQEKRKKNKEVNLSRKFKILTFNTSHKYWVMNNYVFAISSICSLFFSYPISFYEAATTLSFQPPHLVWLAAALITALISFSCFKKLFRLICGEYSYKSNYEIWQIVHDGLGGES